MSTSKILKILFFVFLDVVIFILCGFYMMGYDDFYNDSQGEYFSLTSMDAKYKVVWVFYNLWVFLNCVLLLYVLLRMLKCRNLINFCKSGN